MALQFQGMTSPQAAAAALPSLTELGLLVQHQQSWKSWWLPSLPDFHRTTADRSRNASRSSSPARKRAARSKERERERGEMAFASGPLPFPMLIRTHKHTPTAGEEEATRCGSRPHMFTGNEKHDPASTDHNDTGNHGSHGKHGMDSMQIDDGYDEESTDSDSEDDDISCSLPRPLAPMRWPPSDAKSAMPPDSHGDSVAAKQDRRQVSRGREDDSLSSRPRLFPLRWPLKRQRSKRKREASPSKPPANERSWEPEAREAPEAADDRMAVRVSLRRRVPRRPAGLGMMRAGDMIRSLVSEARRNSDMYVIYKFDRVDELGGRRRGDRM